MTISVIMLPVPRIAAFWLLATCLAISQAANMASFPSGPRVEIRPNVDIFYLESGAHSNKVLTCKALGERPESISRVIWTGPNKYNNSEELKRKHSVKEIANGQGVELAFRRPQSDDAGLYTCVGTFYSTAEYNASVEVKVYEPTKIEHCPDRQTIVQDSPGQRISCTITGEAPRIELFKTINQDNVPIDDEKFKGKYKWDNQGLEILGRADQSDAGVYTVQITIEMLGERRNITINVSVDSKPEIAPARPAANSIAEFEGIEGDRAELKCEVSGKPHPLVYWLDPKLRNLTSVGGYAVNAEQGSLLINKVNRNDDHGNFRCVAYNSVGDTSRTVSMAVLIRPAIVSFENKTVDENSSVVLECRVTGFPKPTVSIRKQGLNQLPYRIGDGNVEDERVDEEGGNAEVYVYRLKLRAPRANFGVHYCNASNTAGSAERIGQLTVRHKPDLSQTPPEQFVKLGKNISVTCHIRAFPAPQVSWFTENDQQIVNPQQSFLTSAEGQTHIVTMMPPPQMQADVARFKCSARNDMGESRQLITTRYQQRPGMVTVQTIDTTPTTIKLHLSVSNDGGDRVKKYKYKLKGFSLDQFNPTYTYPESWQNETFLNAAPTISEYTLKNLLPFYRYTIMIQAINDVDEGPTIEVNAETNRPKEPEPPMIIKPGAAYATSPVIKSDYRNGYVLKWNPPELDNGDPITRYIIKLFKLRDDSSDLNNDRSEPRVIEQMNDRPMHTDIGPLETNQIYRIELQAQNKYGDSKPASIIVQTTSDKPAMDIGPQALAWLTEPLSTAMLITILVAVCILVIIIDLIFCFCFQMGAIHVLRNCCCPPKANSVMSDNTYT